MSVADCKLFVFCFLLFPTSLTLAISGGDYEISWSTIDGGGGRSTSGDFALVGTIGQPDAGQMSGADYKLAGGFWPRGPLVSCLVDFEHFAQFALYWLDESCDEGNDWCFGADLDWSTAVDLSDMRELAYWWLAECPLDWPWE